MRSTSTISVSRNSIWRIELSSVSRSSSGSSSAFSQRRPASPNRSLTSGDTISRRINTAWISFFSRVRASTSPDRRANRRRITLVRSSGIQTVSSDPAARSRASVLASRRSVFARA